MHTRSVPIAPWCVDPYCGKAETTALLLSSLSRAPGGVFAAAQGLLAPWSNPQWYPPLPEHPSNGAFCPAERTRSTGQGSRPLPAGIEVCCQPSARLVLEAQASTPSCHPQLALCAAVRATHPVQSTGKGRRAESRSVSDPGPESLAAEPCPRRDRPVPSAGPGATIRHRVLWLGKK